MSDAPDANVVSPANHLRFALAILRGLLANGGAGPSAPLCQVHREALARVEARIGAAPRGIEGGAR